MSLLKKTLLPIILLLFAYAFWVSPDFKEIAAGVAIFLFGMLFLEDGFKAFTGGILEKVLSKSTSSLPKSITFGILTTTLMQSSSLVSVITISFLSAGLIGLAGGIGIIFGANLGTTTGAWLVAGFGLKVKISAYAMPMIVFGVILAFQSSKKLKGLGYVLAGLGFLFLGIHHMKEGFEAFRSAVDLSQFAVSGYSGLFLFCLIGVTATVIMQSSHATLVLIITALSVGQISYENALALAIGANVGTTITAIIGSLSANYQGKRLALAHLIFNIVTGLIAILFITQIMYAVDAISVRVGIREDDYTLKLAVFHTIFNLIGVLIMTPFTHKLVTLLERVITEPQEVQIEARYLNDSVAEFPETLIEAVKKEVLHLYDVSTEVFIKGLDLPADIVQSEQVDTDLKQSIASRDVDIDEIYLTKIKTLHAAIIDFTTRYQTELPQNYHESLFQLRKASRNIVQTVKEVKHLRKNLSSAISSDNEALRREYNKIRYNIVMVMQLIHNMRQHPIDDDDAFDIYDFDEYLIAAREMVADKDKSLETAILKNELTAYQVTSLMNDLGYGKNIVKLLSGFAKTAFKSDDELLASIEAIVDAERFNGD